MNKNTQDLLNSLKSSADTPDTIAFDLRIDLGEIIVRYLNSEGITQKALAEAAGIPEQVVTRLVHSKSNCRLDTIGKILFALGMRGKLTAGSSSFIATSGCETQASGASEVLAVYKDVNYGQEEDACKIERHERTSLPEETNPDRPCNVAEA